MKMMCGKCGSPIGEGNLVAFCAKCYTELLKENAELRECLGEAVTSRCNFCSAQRMISCVKNEIPCEVKKWRAALAKASGEEVK